MTTTASWVGSAALNPAPQPLPMFASAVRAGFPSPADDYIDAEMDLHGYVVKRPAATFFARSEGDSMIGDGIHHGDLLVVDRSLEPLPGRVIVVALDGELTMKRLERVGRRTYLSASNPAYQPIPLEGREAHVWGVVTHVLHSLPGATPL